MLPPLPPRFIPPLGPPRMSSRERVYAQWRGVNLAPLHTAQAHSARRAGDVLPIVLARDLRIDNRQAEAEVVKVWNQALEPDITRHAQPTGLRKGTLFVSVDSSAWLCEIVRNRRREIMLRMQHSFGREMIKRISFRLG